MSGPGELAPGHGAAEQGAAGPAAAEPGAGRALAAALLRRLAGYRLAHRPEHATSPWTTGYMAVIGALMVAAMGGGGLRWIVAGGAPAGQEAEPRVAAAGGLVLGLAGTAAALLLAALLWAGPIGADAARLTWLHDSPADRPRLLRATAVVTLVVPAGVGGVVAAICAAAVGADAAATGWAVAGGATLGGLLAGLAVAVQTRPRGRSALLRGSLGLAAALVVVGAWVTGPGRGVPVVRTVDAGGLGPLLGGPVLGGLVLGGAIVAGAAVAVHAGWRALRRLDRHTLDRDGATLGAVGGAALMLDAMPLSGLAQGRRTARRGRYPSRRGRLTGAAALVERDLVRLGRRRDLAGVALVLVPVPALVGATVGRWAGLVVAGYLAAGLLGAAATSLRAVQESPSLLRGLPVRGATASVLLLAVPLVAVGVWSVIAVAVPTGGSWVRVAAVVLAATASLLLSVTPQPAATPGPLLATPMGPVPVGLATRVAPTVVVVPVALLALRGGDGVPRLLPALLLALVAALRMDLHRSGGRTLTQRLEEWAEREEAAERRS